VDATLYAYGVNVVVEGEVGEEEVEEGVVSKTNEPN